MMNRGQTLVEYTFLIGIVIALVIAMSPMVKRASQAMVKVVSDEVGLQKSAEQGMVYNMQDPNDVLVARTEGVIRSDVRVDFNRSQQKQEWKPDPNTTQHNTKTSYSETATTTTRSSADLGFTPKD